MKRIALCFLTVLGLIAVSVSHTPGQEPANRAPGWQVMVTAKEKIIIKSPQGHEMICRYIAPGEFTMGSKDGYLAGAARDRYLLFGAGSVKHKKDEGPLRLTKITKGFYMLDTKVWTGLYCEFLNDVETPKSYFQVSGWTRFEWNPTQKRYVPKEDAGLMPVNTTTWHGAEAFCVWLSRKTGRKIRLPTEAEWEYTARGKEGRKFPWGNQQNVFSGYEGGNHTPAWKGNKVKNALDNATPEKVYDMVGCIAEWCSDWYEPDYDPKDNVDPQGPAKTDHVWAKVLRARELSATKREYNAPKPDLSGIYGFRFVLEE